MAINYNSTQPYIPSFLKSALSDSRPAQLTFNDIIETNILSTSSFKYEPLNYPLKSTQQLNVDWSKFENHTFFSSAEVKVNIAFDQIINGFPFDGKQSEVEDFLEKLTGFEKWIYDRFPTFAGQLHFSGTQVGENPAGGYAEKLGTWILTRDTAGWLFPDISKNKSGDSILNPPSNKSMAIEFHAFIPNQSNDRQVVLQKLTDDKLEGFTFHLEPSAGSTVTGVFSITSGSVQNHVQASLQKGVFNHLCLTLSRESGEDLLQFFVNEKLTSNSDRRKKIGAFENKPDFLLGSGSSFYITGSLVSPAQTFSGSLDELRIFHSYRTERQQRLYASKGVYSTDSLKLYYKFNEPSSSISSNTNDVVNSIVLDSSGNSIHGLISNFDVSLRQSATADEFSLMTNEKDVFKKILFPLHPQIVSLNSALLASASLYDQENPNLITKLIPRHYLREGALQEGYANTSVEGSIGENYAGQGVPGQGQIGSAQVMLTFLYIWSKFFDEMKMFADAFKTLRTVDYDINETIPSNFLQDFVKDYGFYMPPLFNSSNVQQYSNAENISELGATNYSLKEVQAYILRRVLINMPDIIASKGTQHSIKSFLRSIGIDPDNSMRIREFGGPSLRQFETSRELKVESNTLVNFYYGGLASTPFLSASRVEPGVPTIAGSFVAGKSNNQNDGLLTSGSWTFEGVYKFTPNKLSYTRQSLARFETTGSAATSQVGLLANLVASSSLCAYIRPGVSSTSPLLKLELTDAYVLDGDRWNISFGCVRNDSIDSLVSSSYFLRAAKQNAGEIYEYYTTSSFFQEDPTSSGNMLRQVSAAYNASGSRISIGNDPNIPEGVMGYLFLNNTFDVIEDARTSDFEGKVGHVRFWSKGLTEKEWREHVKNYKSYGVEDPLTNYNYVTNKSGSFEKLRLATMEKQAHVTASQNGSMTFLDFSENNFHMSGSGFTTYSNVLVGEIFERSYISPYFDEYSTNEKVRIRSFKNEENLIDSPWAVLGSMTEFPADEIPNDDPRLSIEFSLLDSLNKDIINMFASLDEMALALGDPTLAFSPDYPDLDKLRNIYFNRISEKLNFRSFFEFYRWFDLSISTFIEQLVPRKTRFKGTNFIVESHMLERHKIEYQSSEIYLGDSTRSRIKDTLLVQQVVGKINKY